MKMAHAELLGTEGFFLPLLLLLQHSPAAMEAPS